MKTTKILTAVVLSALISGGCTAHKTTFQQQGKTYRPPQAHIECHKRLLSRQNQFMDIKETPLYHGND